MLSIKIFPCLYDNYGFLLHDSESGRTATIDTPEAAKIKTALAEGDGAEGDGAEGDGAENDWALSEIWNTHHHPDHVGGNLALAQSEGAIIRGPEVDAARIPGLTHGVNGGEHFMFGRHEVHVIFTPGHTTGHIIYYVPDAKAAFVGDTIFVMGCGRLFEGTAQDMWESMAAIAKLPDETLLYCAHEYTLANARFAITAEPDNADIIAYTAEAKALREKNLPTVPTTVGREKKINPFMRAATAKRLGEIRKAKDSF